MEPQHIPYEYLGEGTATVVMGWVGWIMWKLTGVLRVELGHIRERLGEISGKLDKINGRSEP